MCWYLSTPKQISHTDRSDATHKKNKTFLFPLIFKTSFWHTFQRSFVCCLRLIIMIYWIHIGCESDLVWNARAQCLVQFSSVMNFHKMGINIDCRFPFCAPPNKPLIMVHSMCMQHFKCQALVVVFFPSYSSMVSSDRLSQKYHIVFQCNLLATLR